MKFFTGVLIILSFKTTDISGQPTSEWKQIFNGIDLNGWSIIGGEGKVNIADSCLILQMKANTTEHTFVKSNKKYKDFILEIDVKRDPGFFYGILFRARNAPDTAHVRLYGYQVKADHLPNRRWTGGIFDDFGNTWNWLYPLEGNPMAQNATHDPGIWDHLRIEAIGDHIKVWLNDIPTTNLINTKYPRGYIAFKIHFLDGRPENEKAAGWIKNVRIIDNHPARYSRPMALAVKNVE
jgi:hypothetical protein